LAGISPDDAMSTFVRAEAWAKAAGCGFAFGAAHFLRNAAHGLLPDGRLLRDLDLSERLQGLAGKDSRITAAICADARCPEPVIPPPSPCGEREADAPQTGPRAPG